VIEEAMQRIAAGRQKGQRAQQAARWQLEADERMAKANLLGHFGVVVYG
jgi:hypothetical protein